jgi:hypothetical protein
MSVRAYEKNGTSHSFKTPLFVAMVLISLLIGCSHASENKHSEVTVFQGEGEKWKVSIPNEVILKNGQKYFPTIFRFKGDPEELKEVEHISFALGTELGTRRFARRRRPLRKRMLCECTK